MLKHFKSILVLILALALVSGSCICTIAAEPVDRIVFHVSTSGNDKNPGTEAAPFATVQKAAETVKKIKHTNIPVDILIHGGTYQIDRTVDFSGASASGTEGAPVTYKAAGDGKVVFSGFKEIPLSNFGRITDEEMKLRFREEVRSEIGAVDLASLGFVRENLDILLNKSKLVSPPDTHEYSVLRLNGKEQWLAQWPDFGEYARFGDVVNGGGSSVAPVVKYTDSTFDRWQDWSTALVRGYVSNVYLEQWNQIESIDKENQTITFKYGITGKVTPGRTWRILNIPEELDKPGEYFVDVKTMTLYFYPPYKLNKNDTLELSHSKNVYFQLEGSRYINFDGITFEGFRCTSNVRPNCLFNIVGGEYINITNCVFQYNAGNACVRIEGKNCLVRACGFYNCGAAAIYVDDRGNSFAKNPTLQHDKNIIENNHFYNTGHENNQNTTGAITGNLTSWYKSGASVGNIVRNNLIHHIYGQISVRFDEGVEWDVSYNEISNGLRIHADCGLIYTGGSGGIYGMGNTFSYNYLHDWASALDPTYSAVGLYFDDWISGQNAYNNIFIPGSDTATTSLLNVGAYTTAKNNISVGGKQALGSSDRGTNISSSANLKEWVEKLGALPEALKGKYSHMENVYHKTLERGGVFANIGNRYTDNVTVNGQNNFSEYSIANGTFENNYVGTDMSIFVDPDNHDWRIKSEKAEELGFGKDVITDKNFDMDRIGIQKDVWDIKNPLEPFMQTYPANGATGVSSKNVRLGWEPALFADEYDYVLATDPELKDVVASGTTYFEFADVGDLDLGKSYYWKVTARNTTKQLGAEWESVGVPYLFTVTNREPTDKLFLEINLATAKRELADVKDGTGNPGEFKEGTEARITKLIADSEDALVNYTITQGKIDTLTKKLDEAVKGKSSFKNMAWRTIDVSSDTKWLPAKDTTTATVGDGVVTLNGSATVAYNDRVENYEMFKFRYKADHSQSTGWTGLALRQGDPKGNVYGGVQYMVAIKPDIFEFQKYKAGAPATGIILTEPNNGVVPNDRWCDIEFGVADVDGGTYIFFNVDGKKVFDYYDTETPIYSDGHFCIKPPPGIPLYLAPSEDMPEGLYNPPTDLADRGTFVTYDHTSDVCETEGTWKSTGGYTTGYNKTGLRLSDSEDAKVTYKFGGKRSENKMFSYWHSPVADGDKNVVVTIEYNYEGTEEKTTRTIDFSNGIEGWVPLGAFPFNSFDGTGTVKITVKGSGEGTMVLPVMRLDDITLEQKDFAHLFYKKAENMTAIKINSDYGFVNGGKMNIPDVPAQVINGKTYLPLRFVANAFGYSAVWDEKSACAVITSADKVIKVKPDKTYMTVDGKEVELEETALAIDGRILLPIRDIAEAMGKKVLWYGDTETVLIADRLDITEADKDTFELIDKQFRGDEDEY